MRRQAKVLFRALLLAAPIAIAQTAFVPPPDPSPDFTEFCVRQGERGAENVDKTSNGWRCIPSGSNIQVQLVCQSKHGNYSRAYLQGGGMTGNALDWRCTTPEVPIPAPASAQPPAQPGNSQTQPRFIGGVGRVTGSSTPQRVTTPGPGPEALICPMQASKCEGMYGSTCIMPGTGHQCFRGVACPQGQYLCEGTGVKPVCFNPVTERCAASVTFNPDAASRPPYQPPR
jgi:hypothetical protein